MEDYEELMLQISDVMREGNRVRPDLSHEQAIKNIRGIVERHGKWIGDTDYESFQGSYEAYKCSICGHSLHWRDYCSNEYNFCPNCGARMER